ncbi:glutaredoxin-1-like [Apostichopus japonicus]|uniref:glutaredoxin-1-like n=1 Tax=Stichopus japonicus TaxID=307972 RepID=UPI003AB87BC4
MVKQFVDAQIKNNKVVVFSKSYCPYCKMAKSALSDAGLKEYTLIEIENRDDCSDIQDYLLSLTGGRSVPRVFINGKFVGGGSELKSFQAKGKLVPMLKEAQAL